MTEYKDCAICGAATETKNLSLARTSIGDMGLCVHCYLAYRIGYNTRQVHAEDEKEKVHFYKIPDPPYNEGEQVLTSYEVTAVRKGIGSVYEIDIKDRRDGSIDTCVVPFHADERGKWLVQEEINNHAFKKEKVEFPAPYKPGDEVMSYYKITAVRMECRVHELDYKDTRDGSTGQVGIPFTGAERGQWLVQAEIKGQAYKRRIAELEGKP